MTFLINNILVMCNFVLFIIQCKLLNAILFNIKTYHKVMDWIMIGISCVFIVLGLIPDSMIIVGVLVFINLMISLKCANVKKTKVSIKIIFLNVCITYILELLVLITTNTYRKSKESFLFTNIILCLILIIIKLVKKKIVLWKNKIIKPVVSKVMMYIAIIIIGVSIPLTVSLLTFAAEYIDMELFYKVTHIVAIFAFVSLIFLLVLIFIFREMNEKIRNSLYIEKRLISMQKKYYKELLAREEETRKFRHDIINHLICLKEFVHSDNRDLAEKYIEKLNSNIMTIQRKCYAVGNEVIDVILNVYLQQLQDTKVTVKGMCADDIDISDVDLCTIFSNLLQNAVEEMNRINEEDKYIKIIFTNGEKNTKIQIINNTRSINDMGIDGYPKTKKQDKENHGIGLINVEQTVSRNNGIFEYECVDNEFRVSIYLLRK